MTIQEIEKVSDRIMKLYKLQTGPENGFLCQADFVRVMRYAINKYSSSGIERDALIAVVDAACVETGWNRNNTRMAMLED